MGDLDLSELWDGTQLEKIAEDSGYDAEEMTSKMLENLADHDDWLGQDEEADDYSDEIAELAKRTCEQYDQEDGGARTMPPRTKRPPWTRTKQRCCTVCSRGRGQTRY